MLRRPFSYKDIELSKVCTWHLDELSTDAGSRAVLPTIHYIQWNNCRVVLGSREMQIAIDIR